MRESINRGVQLSNGNYIMKIDEHCLVSHGYDIGLIADCEEHDVIIPRRYRLSPAAWMIEEDGRAPVDYMHIDYAFQRINDKRCGLHGNIWKRKERAEILIDETPTMQGSCYFMPRKHWDEVLVELDSDLYGNFTHEAQEISCKTWFTGGRVMVNKKVFYAHWHKGKKGRNYGFSTQQYINHGKSMNEGRIFCREYWLNTKDYKYDWEWFMTKFPDMPGWGPNWRENLKRDYELEEDKLKINV